MLRRTPAIVGSVAILGMCAIQGCSSNTSSQAGSGTSPNTTSGSGAGTSSAAAASTATGGSSGSGGSGSPTAKASGKSGTVVNVGASTGPVVSSGTFTVPAASSAVVGHGSYQKLSGGRMHVQVCAQKVGKAFAVGVEAIGYNADYSKQGKIAATILPETPGQAGCTQINLLYSAHLKVFSFIGNGGSITKQSAMKVIF